MGKIENRKFRVALLLLPVFVFLLYASVSYALVNSQIHAIVTLYPSAKVDCKPDILTVGSSVQWINCFTELEGADVHDINPANVQLTVLGKLGSVPADPFFSQFDDFNSDGKTEIMLRFSRSSADTAWFNSLTQNTNLTFNLIGSVNNFPFSGTSPILVVKTTTYSLVEYSQLNAPAIGDAKINWLYGPDWFNYKNYTPSYLHFSGYFYKGMYKGTSRFFGISSFYSKGYVTVERTVHYWFFDQKITEQQPVTISVIMNSYYDCYADKGTKNVHCEGPAQLIISKDRTGIQYTTDLPNFRFDIKNYKATLEGGKIWNEVIKVSDITMTRINIS
jgi:hypothetical protein